MIGNIGDGVRELIICDNVVGVGEIILVFFLGKDVDIRVSKFLGF